MGKAQRDTKITGQVSDTLTTGTGSLSSPKWADNAEKHG